MFNGTVNTIRSDVVSRNRKTEYAALVRLLTQAKETPKKEVGLSRVTNTKRKTRKG